MKPAALPPEHGWTDSDILAAWEAGAFSAVTRVLIFPDARRRGALEHLRIEKTKRLARAESARHKQEGRK
jgi:hypothetical protein